MELLGDVRKQLESYTSCRGPGPQAYYRHHSGVDPLPSSDPEDSEDIKAIDVSWGVNVRLRTLLRLSCAMIPTSTKLCVVTMRTEFLHKGLDVRRKESHDLMLTIRAGSLTLTRSASDAQHAKVNKAI